MKRLITTAIFTLVALCGWAEEQKPIYIVNGCVRSVEEVEKISPSEIESVTIVRETQQLKQYEQFGDTSNGVVLISLLNEHVWVASEVPPTFMDGDVNTFIKWVMQNYRYPADMLAQKKSAKMMIKFIVSKQGFIDPQSIKFLESAEQPFMDEARRVLLSSPQWKPGLQKGEPVAVSFLIPIICTLQ